MSLETYREVVFDSREEVWMAMWLEELRIKGYVKYWEKVNKPMSIFNSYNRSYNKITELKKSRKIETKVFTLLKPLSYTPDFEICWSERGWDIFVSTIADGINPKSWFFGVQESGRRTFVEVKPVFDQNDKTAKFSIIQKILWHTQRLFVDLIIPEKLFEGTFMPLEAMPEFKYKKKPTGKNKGIKGPGDWKTNYIPKTLNEFLNA